MNQATIEWLNQINHDFYRASAVDFDATRQAAWPGWERLLKAFELPIASVLDLGCGNGRFALFLAARQLQPFSYIGIDSNPELLAFARRRLAPHIADLTLIETDLVLDELPPMSAQLVTLFGLVHHVPGFERRRALLASAAERVASGGYLALACWRFFEQERFRRRIVPWRDDIKVEKHDYLLDWRRGERALRYCHYVDDEEHALLIAATGLSLIADYRADGAEGDLNRYAILQRECGGDSVSRPPDAT